MSRILANYVMWRATQGLLSTQGEKYAELLRKYNKVLQIIGFYPFNAKPSPTENVGGRPRIERVNKICVTLPVEENDIEIES